MMGGKKGGKSEDAVEDRVRAPLQAVLLADSFTAKFCPITHECPKVLLPLVNTTMIDYTLAWLEDAGIQKVFVICCSHSKQIINHLDKCGWNKQPNFTVTTIERQNCISVGDALRAIYDEHVRDGDARDGDFVLVSGDTVSNMDLTQALQEHKERSKKDSEAVMTMVIKRSPPSQVTRQTRLGTDELIMAIDPSTKQLLYYEDKADDPKAIITLDKSFLAENPSISLHNDKQDCYIDICSRGVLDIFVDNFDWGDLRGDFVKGLLHNYDVMGCKIFTHEIHSHYAARIDNFRSYASISKDIIQRWTYPFVPDVQFSTNTAAKLGRYGIYQGSEISQSRSAEVGPFTYIGKGSSIGNNTKISNSVVGYDCKIGHNVSIDGCYVWNGVTIEDGCKLNHAILCDGVVMKSGAVLQPGVVLSYKVVVGQEFVVPAYSKVSLLPQPVTQDSDQELEYADNNSVVIPTMNTSEKGDSTNNIASSQMGNGGRGFIWSISEADHEEWKHSIAPVPAEKLIELTQAFYDDLDIDGRESGTESDDDVKEARYFEKEVEETFLRRVNKNLKEGELRMLEVEVNSLKLAHNMTIEKCASALLYSMMNLALRKPHRSPTDLVNNVNDVISHWVNFLKVYLPSVDEEIEVIMKFEEMCLESSKEYAPLFVSILHLLYDKSIIQEDAIFMWANEKENADESDKVFLKQSEEFIQWLNEASEEED